jgi:hypothetical protein
MRIYKYRRFHEWAKLEQIDGSSLKNTIKELEQGLFGAHLGAGLYKKRIARKGRGKRSGYRVLIALKENEFAIFMYGFVKNKCQNIDLKEKEIYKNLAKYYINASDAQINKLISIRELIEDCL